MPSENTRIDLPGQQRGSSIPLPPMRNQTPIQQLLENNIISYRTGRNTMSFTWDGSKSANPLDGNRQLRVERSHGGAWSTGATKSDSRDTLAFGPRDNKVKWIQDPEGAGIGLEHMMSHNSTVSSHFESGVRNNNGSLGGFRWTLGLN